MIRRGGAERVTPVLPAVSDDPKSHTEMLRAIAEALNVRERRTRDLDSSFITVKDLTDSGLIEIRNGQFCRILPNYVPTIPDDDDVVVPETNEVISPFDYDAVGDGVTDDTAAVQAAIDDIAAFGALDLSGGSFLVDTLTLDARDITIRGPGRLIASSSIPTNGAILLSLSAGADAGDNQALLDGIYGASVQSVRTSVTGSLENVHIDNVTFEGGTNAIRGIWMTAFTRGCRIKGCYFDGCDDYGIAINGSWSFTLLSNFCEGDGVSGVGIGLGIIGNGKRSGAVAVNGMTLIGNEVTAMNGGCQYDFGVAALIAGNIWEFNDTFGFATQSTSGVSYKGNYHEGNGSTVTNNNGNMRLGGTNGSDFVIGWDLTGNHFRQLTTTGHNIIMRGMQNCKVGRNNYSGSRTQHYFITSGAGVYMTDNQIQVPDLTTTYITNMAAEANAAYNHWHPANSDKKFQDTANGNHTFDIQDPAKILVKASGGAGETWTIPANGTVPMPVGTELEGINNGGGDLTLAITTDTLSGDTNVPTGTGFKIVKVGTTTWVRLEKIAVAGGDGLGSDGDKGDITVGGTGTTLTIDAGVVTLAKMADLAQDQFIGRTTGSTGVPQTATITSAARTVLDDTTVGAMLTTMGGAPLASPTFTGTVTIPTPFTLGAVSVLPTGTELNFVDGVTSAIQTQIDTKTGTANSPNSGEWAKFTAATTIEGRTAAELRSDLEFETTKAGADVAVNDTNDVTMATRTVTGLVAGDQVIVESFFTILNDSTATRVYTMTLDYDAVFDIEFATGALATSATLRHPFHIMAVLDIRSTSLAYCVVRADGQVAAGTASGADTTQAATNLQGMSWGTSGSNLTGSTDVTLKCRSANNTATQTFRLHSFCVRKLTPT